LAAAQRIINLADEQQAADAIRLCRTDNERLTEQHMPTLASNESQLICKDEYGKYVFGDFEKKLVMRTTTLRFPR
jgi:hypothetical protein